MYWIISKLKYGSREKTSCPILMDDQIDYPFTFFSCCLIGFNVFQDSMRIFKLMCGVIHHSYHQVCLSCNSFINKHGKYCYNKRKQLNQSNLNPQATKTCGYGLQTLQSQAMSLQLVRCILKEWDQSHTCVGVWVIHYTVCRKKRFSTVFKGSAPNTMCSLLAQPLHQVIWKSVW